MPSWFRSGLPPHQTALAMVGAKAGQTVIFLGAAEPELAAEVARVTGLTGRTVVAAGSGRARAAIETAAARAGTLVELAGKGPAEVAEPDGTFDLAGVTTAWLDETPEVRRATIREAYRLVRPGGRIVMVISTGPRHWPGGTKPVPPEVSGEALEFLTAAGARAVRLLGEVPGTTYLEGVKPRTT